MFSRSVFYLLRSEVRRSPVAFLQVREPLISRTPTCFQTLILNRNGHSDNRFRRKKSPNPKPGANGVKDNAFVPLKPKELASFPLKPNTSLRNPYMKKKARSSSGKGRYHGRGNKGYKARHGSRTHSIDYEGGRPPFVTSQVPKFGSIKKKIIKRDSFTPLSFIKIKDMIEMGVIDPQRKITVKSLIELGVVEGVECGINLVPFGSNEFRYKIDIEVNRAVPAAIDVVEDLGGKIRIVHDSKEIIEYYKNPNDFFFEPFQTVPSRVNDIEMFADENRRGYLAEIAKECESLEELIDKLIELNSKNRKEFERRISKLPEYPKPPSKNPAVEVNNK